MPNYNDDDRPKRSWRDIDKNKDRSRHRLEDRPAMNPKKQARANSASQVYRSKLDAFFDGDGKAPAHIKEKLETIKDSSADGKQRLKALKAIKDATTSAAADKAVGAYLKQWEIPPDYDVLAQVLTCGEESYVETAMGVIGKMLADKRIPRQAALLEQRLRRVKTLAEDPDLQDSADQLLRELRLFKK